MAMSLDDRRGSTLSFNHNQISRPKPAQQISGSSSTTNWTSTEEEEGRPDIYIRLDHKLERGGYEWFCLKHNDYLSSKLPPICKCGAVEDLKSPVFSQPREFQPLSSAAAVGPLIYLFGGMDFKDGCVNTAEVSYIDTLHPEDGWKVCKNKMPKEQSASYSVTLDDGWVLLVGGFDVGGGGDRPSSQMFNSKEDKWVALKSYPNTTPYSLDLDGHAIVEEGGETMILMHKFGTPHLYTYNVSTYSWGTRWKDEFKTHYNSGALVNDIYYVVDVVSRVSTACPNRVVLCGYKVSSLQAECLPVEILVEENDGKKNWLPLPDCYNRIPWPKLLTCGDNKLGMIWYDYCLHDKTTGTRFSYYWSIFEMTEDRTDGGVVRLAAHPLSQVCYHVYNMPSLLDRLVPVFLVPPRRRIGLQQKKKKKKEDLRYTSVSTTDWGMAGMNGSASSTMISCRLSCHPNASVGLSKISSLLFLANPANSNPALPLQQLGP